jgi:formate dehydrogenase major subunit
MTNGWIDIKNTDMMLVMGSNPAENSFDAATQTYDHSSWNYEAEGGAASAGLPGEVAYDLTLQHPRCVFQLLRRQYSRYTPEMVERITGIPKEQFLKAADLFTSVRIDGNMKKAATIIYAVGWTRHSFGTQIPVLMNS